MTTRQTPDAVREAANVASFHAIHGDGDPFANPETFDFASKVAGAVIAALDSRADHDRRIYEQGRRDACEDHDIALDSRAGDAGEVTDAMVDAALAARLPGGTPVLAYLPTESTWEPTDRAKEIVRAILSATSAPEPFGYWVEQKHADPVLLRKPAYIPETSDLRTVTPLYAAPAVDAVPAGEVVQRLARIRTSMALLQQNSEGCAQNHYGVALAAHGMPSWLVDTKADLEAFTDIIRSLGEAK